MSELWIERRKWPNLPHYGHDGWPLGEDAHGLWIELRVGCPVYRGTELLFHGTGGGLMLAPPHGRWLAWFPEFGPFEVYVDIVTGMQRSATALTMVDVDLDVVRTREGDVQLLDEDEFEIHQVRYGYSAEMIASAVETAAEVMQHVTEERPPFDRASAATWAAQITRS